MCCNNKCLFFIKVRTGSLIFGYIAAIITAIGVLVSTGLIFAFTTIIVRGSLVEFSVAPVFFVQICFFLFTAGFTFTVLLLCGITKHKPVLVKTYIIYGMVKLVLLLVTVAILFSIELVIVGVFGLLFCCIYASIIYMIYLTYKIIVIESENTNSGRSFLSGA